MNRHSHPLPHHQNSMSPGQQRESGYHLHPCGDRCPRDIVQWDHLGEEAMGTASGRVHVGEEGPGAGSCGHSGMRCSQQQLKDPPGGLHAVTFFLFASGKVFSI